MNFELQQALQYQFSIKCSFLKNKQNKDVVSNDNLASTITHQMLCCARVLGQEVQPEEEGIIVRTDYVVGRFVRGCLAYGKLLGLVVRDRFGDEM